MRKRYNRFDAKSVYERFSENVVQGSAAECWLWVGAKSKRGYGRLYEGPRGGVTTHLAHRIAWEIANGRKVSPGKHVLHSCDNPPCVNPAHLREGTAEDNVQDRVARGRGASGQSYPHFQRTEDRVRAILDLYVKGHSTRQIAALTKISKSTIAVVVKGIRAKGFNQGEKNPMYKHGRYVGTKARRIIEDP